MNSVIAVHSHRMPLVEFRGLRVVTFSMVDEAHQRPKGTAKAAFSRNRHRFIEKEDFFIVPASMVNWGGAVHLARGIKRTGKKMNNSISVRGRITLLTEMGYLLLVKSFNDDLAWQVQRQLVNAYFRQPEKVTFHHIELPTLNELASMSLEEAQHTVAQAEQRSRVFHGSQGSAGLHMRKSELKKLRPAMRLVDAMGQISFDGWETGNE